MTKRELELVMRCVSPAPMVSWKCTKTSCYCGLMRVVGMCEYTDPCDVWKESWPRARKNWMCRGCHSVIPVGAIYCNIRTLYDGHWDTLHVCGLCYRVGQELRKECGTWCPENLACDAEEHRLHERIPGLVHTALRVRAGMNA